MTRSEQSAFGATIASTVRTLTFADGDRWDRLRHLSARRTDPPIVSVRIAIESGPAAVGDAITGREGGTGNPPRLPVKRRGTAHLTAARRRPRRRAGCSMSVLPCPARCPKSTLG